MELIFQTFEAFPRRPEISTPRCIDVILADIEYIHCPRLSATVADSRFH